jgi:hypothetical protein
VSGKAIAIATVGGAIMGIAYTLSPLAVWFAFAFVVLCRVAVRGLDAEERRIVIGILVVAAVTRLAVVGGLFAYTDHQSVPFGSLFGDEEYFKRRSLWLRSMALHVDISVADRVYATDEYSDTSYLYLLALIQILVGDAPYGVHAFSILLYLVGAVILFRFMRESFGSAPALLSFVFVLFLPSLFLWSVSALRESIHFMLTVIAIVGGVGVANGSRRLTHRIAWAVVAIGATVALRDLRAGSMVIVAASVIFAVGAGVLTRYPRLLTLAAVTAAIVISVAVTRPAVQARVVSTVRTGAMIHQGHVFTPGLHYKLLDPRFYLERNMGMMDSLTLEEGARFVLRALVAAVVVPLPWQADSRLIQVYLPEQLFWYALVLLFPFGVVIGWRYARMQTLVFTAYVVFMGTAIALNSGNVGTLIRHRGLLWPFVICVASVAVCHALTRTAPRSWPLLARPTERTV